jgi:hypothetical protein
LIHIRPAVTIASASAKTLTLAVSAAMSAVGEEEIHTLGEITHVAMTTAVLADARERDMMSAPSALTASTVATVATGSNVNEAIVADEADAVTVVMDHHLAAATGRSRSRHRSKSASPPQISQMSSLSRSASDA